VTVPNSPPQRFLSLDVFRGATIVAMILVNNPGDRSVAYSQLLHSSWNGFTFADTIFPAFLWIAGFAMTLSMRARAARGDDRAAQLIHVMKRAAVLIACGLFVEGFPYFELATWQVTGVLQKIAISYSIAFAICLNVGWRGQLLALGLLFVAYIGFMLGVTPPNCTDGAWSATCNASRYLNDMVLAGHMWATPSHNDPDGVVGCLAATSSVLLGVLAAWLYATSGPARVAIRRMSALAVTLMLAGMLLSLWIPINKILWTPSYSLFMAGVSAAVFVLVFWLVDLRAYTAWSRPLQVFGLNALAAYILSRFGDDLLKMHIAGWSIYHDLMLAYASPATASFLFACLNVAAVYLIVWIMFRLRIFVKL
jgi:predicted acyltransferase